MTNNENKIPSRANWSCLCGSDSILKNKKRLKESYIKNMFAKTQSIFEYDDLPETIPQKDFEFILQANGHGTIGKTDNGELYAFSGALGGELGAYYLPTISVVNNPYLKFNKTFKIGVDCVVITNDSMYSSLFPIFERYAELLTEVDISIKKASINARVMAFVEADNDGTKASAEKYFEKINDGQDGVIGSNEFFKGLHITPTPTGQSNVIKDLMELKQYLSSSWFIELGLNANYNMKREAINESESAMNEDALLPYIDDMLKARQKGVEEINKMFGTNISVRLSSAWQNVREKQDISTGEQEPTKQEQTTQEDEKGAE